MQLRISELKIKKQNENKNKKLQRETHKGIDLELKIERKWRVKTSSSFAASGGDG